MHGRGQTTQDYVVGISIVLLTVAGVFTFVPAVFETTEDPVDRNAYTQAEALGDRLVETQATGDRHVSFERLDRRLSALDARIENDDPSPLLGAAGIRQDDREIRRVNVTVTEAVAGESDPVLTAGEPYVLGDTSETTATVTRLIAFGNESRCGDSGVCHLTVRVW